MKDTNDKLGAKELVRKIGPGEPASIETIRAEIRSNDSWPPPPPPPPPPEDGSETEEGSGAEESAEFAIGHLVIEWQYQVAFSEVLEFQKFLQDTELAIHTGVKTSNELEGVSYMGTYVAILNSDNIFRTYWAYDNLSDVKKWGDLSESSSLYKNVKELRKWWLRDPSRKELRFQPACLFTEDKIIGDHPISGFFKLTLKAAEELAKD